MLPKIEGRYIAQPIEWTVEESGDNRIPTFVCKFDLLQVLQNEGWNDVSDQQIIGYFFIFKKDGTINTNTVDSLKAALGWDGRGISSLADGEWSHTEVQLTIGSEEYKGKTQMRVKYINPRDWTPTGLEKDPQVVQSLEAKYGAKLRALAGPASAPTAPSKPAASNGDAATQSARKMAWEAFQKKHPGKSNDELIQPWRDQIKAVIPDRNSQTFTGADWMKIKSVIEQPESPISDIPQFEEDQIPF